MTENQTTNQTRKAPSTAPGDRYNTVRKWALLGALVISVVWHLAIGVSVSTLFGSRNSRRPVASDDKISIRMMPSRMKTPSLAKAPASATMPETPKEILATPTPTPRLAEKKTPTPIPIVAPTPEPKVVSAPTPRRFTTPAPAPVRVTEAKTVPPIRPVRNPVTVPVVPLTAPEEIVSAGKGNPISDRKPVPALRGAADGDRRLTIAPEKTVGVAPQPRTSTVAATPAETIRTIKPDVIPTAPANPASLAPTISTAPPIPKTVPGAITGNDSGKSDTLGINRGVPFGDELGITRGVAGGGGGVGKGAGGNGGAGRGLGANSYSPGTPRFTLARPTRTDDGPPIHIVYVIDVSGSMEEGGKIQRVRDAMEKALGELRNEDYFNIVFFSDRATLFAPTMRPATPSNVSAGVLSVGVNQPNGATNLSAALDLALDQPEITHIFLMSDGEPTEGVTDFNMILSLARQRNHNSARILTLALGQGEKFKGMTLLRELAEEGRGVFHYIDLRKR